MPDPKPDEPAASDAAVEQPVQVRPFEDLLGELDARLRQEPEAREQLRHHEIIAGIAGEIGNRIATDRLNAAQLQAAEAAARANEAAMLKLANEDPEAFAAKFATDKQAELARRTLADLAFQERNRIASHVGRAMTDLPEWKLLSQEDLASVAEALVGVPDEQVIGVYNRVALGLLSKRQAAKLVESQLTERLKAEREAWDNEMSGRRTRSQPAPRIGERPTMPSPDTDEPDFKTDPDSYNRWYEENVLKRRR